MAQTDGEIKLKDCPKCKTPIAKTQRFMNMVKKVYQDVRRVKSCVFGNMREIEASRDELRNKLYDLMAKLDSGKHYDGFLIHHTSLLEGNWAKLDSGKRYDRSLIHHTSLLKGN